MTKAAKRLTPRWADRPRLTPAMLSHRNVCAEKRFPGSTDRPEGGLLVGAVLPLEQRPAEDVDVEADP